MSRWCVCVRTHARMYVCVLSPSLPQHLPPPSPYLPLPPGSFDLTVTHSRYGRSTPITNRIGLSADGFKPYLYQTHAHIDSVSPSSGSTEGGTVITIQGKGFYPNTSNDITVLVGGVECEVLNVSSTEIQCRTGPRSDRLPLYPGEIMGMKLSDNGNGTE